MAEAVAKLANPIPAVARAIQTIQSEQPSPAEARRSGYISLAAGILASFSGLPAIGVTALTTAAKYAEAPMSINLGGLLGAAGGILGGINTSGFGNISQVLGGGLQLAGAALTPQQPTYMTSPQYSQPMYQTGLAPSSQVIRSAAPAIAGAVVASGGFGAIAAARALLPKVAAALGKRGISLSAAVGVARKLGKFLTSPESIAVYMGLTVAELATLITASSARKRRRMNPANAHALRRAARRIKSFHKLCQHTDLIKTHRRSAARCGTCKKSPCRC